MQSSKLHIKQTSISRYILFVPHLHYDSLHYPTTVTSAILYASTTHMHRYRPSARAQHNPSFPSGLLYLQSLSCSAVCISSGGLHNKVPVTSSIQRRAFCSAWSSYLESICQNYNKITSYIERADWIEISEGFPKPVFVKKRLSLKWIRILECLVF